MSVTYLEKVREVTRPVVDAAGAAHYWDLASSTEGARDRLGSLNGKMFTQAPNGLVVSGGADSKTVFEGTTYLEVADHQDLSISTRGALSVAFWAGCSWKAVGGNGEYCNFWGKGVGSGSTGQQEYCGRYYIKGSTKGEAPARQGRMSGYAFNLSGDKGSGSYHQDGSCPTAERFICVTYDMKEIRFYCGDTRGVVMQHAPVPMSQYSVVPKNGTAPFRFGTRDKSGYFVGTGRRLLMVSGNRVLNADEIKALSLAGSLPDKVSEPAPGDGTGGTVPENPAYDPAMGEALYRAMEGLGWTPPQQ